MIEYRPFQNTDPPGIAEIWRCQHRLRRLAQSVTWDILEEQVLSKPYFDRQGLIVAVQAGRLIGFVHAGFGPAADGSDIDRSMGNICLLMTRPGPESVAAVRPLLQRGLSYLHERGTHVVYAGAASPQAPFYHGLYGGGNVPGILAEDQVTLNELSAAGFIEQTRHMILELELGRFQAVMDREQLQIRRACQVQVMIDPPASTWWGACTTGWGQQIQFTARTRRDGSRLGHVTFSDMPVLAKDWGAYVVALNQIRVALDRQFKPSAIYLLNDALRQLASDGVMLVEAQVEPTEVELLDVLRAFDFRAVDVGITLKKL